MRKLGENLQNKKTFLKKINIQKKFVSSSINPVSIFSNYTIKTKK